MRVPATRGGDLDTIKLWIKSAESMTGLPRNALFASVVLIFGWLFALLVRALVARSVREVGRLLSNGRSIDDVEDAMSRHRVDLLFGRGAFWVVVLLTLMAATEL